jgi:cytochrome P450
MQGLDLTDRANFANGFPHQHFTWARQNAPIYWHEPTETTPGGEGFWVMSRHEDAMAILLDPGTYSSDTGGGRSGGGTALHDDRGAGKFLIMSDDPRHKRLRSIVNKGFTNREIHKLEGMLRARVGKLIDDFPEGEPFDFVPALARDLPLQAICFVLGVPEADRRQLGAWVDAGIEALSDRIIAPEYVHKLRDYGAAIIEERRRAPADDILSIIVHAKLENEDAATAQLTQAELINFFMLLFAAGAETTRGAIAGGMRALIDHPEQLERLRSAPVAALRVAIEEILRWTTPSVYKRRTATRDVDFKGFKIREGDKVTFWEMSANRDEAIFDKPFVFDTARTPNRHIAFGFGAHVCLGASLARLELRVALEELMRRVASFAIAGPVAWVPNNRLLGLKSLPLRVRKARIDVPA